MSDSANQSNGRIILSENIHSDDALNGGADEREALKEKILSAFEHDHLFPLVSKEYDIVSDDILKLDMNKSYSTKEVAEILGKYDFLYDGTKGESYINENRLRWWLNDKDEDNFIQYFNLEKVGRSWVWRIEAICKAKIVAILRFCKNMPQKQILVKLTGLMPDTPKITGENITSLIQSGQLNQVHDVGSLRDILLAAVVHMTGNYAELYGQLESLKEENDDLRNQLETLREVASSALPAAKYEEDKTALTKKQDELLEQHNVLENEIKQKDQKMLVALKEAEYRADLRKKALEEWDKQGLLKRLRSKESDKEAFIENFISQKIGPLLDGYRNSFAKESDVSSEG